MIRCIKGFYFKRKSHFVADILWFHVCDNRFFSKSTFVDLLFGTKSLSFIYALKKKWFVL